MKKIKNLASTQKLYEKMAQGEVKGFTVPAFNIRTLTFDVGRALFRAARKEKAGAFIIELAKSEIDYTGQSLEEYRDSILKAADKEKFEGAIFLQADHFRINEDLENLIKKAIENGFYNIDIDCSSLPLKDNYLKTAEFTAFIRNIEPKNVSISIGGEVGEIGGKNTTLEEFREFIKGYKNKLSNYPNLKGLIKIAIQTGTSHGGIMLPTGELKIPEEDFETLAEISREAKKYGLAGAVQHGASTLPEKYFERFPQTGACEIHLATIFQNIIYDSDYFPQDLKEKIYKWLKKNYFQEKKETENELQFLYRLRKKALGPFKKEIWNIPQKNIDRISEELEEKFIFFFQKLNVSKSSDLIKNLTNIK